MKDFGVWYFEYGYLLMTVIALVGGTQCKNAKQLTLFVIGIIAFGVFALYCKYQF